MRYARVPIRGHDDKGLSNLVCTILHCIYGKRGMAGVFGSEQGGVGASVLARRPKLWIFGNGIVLCIKDHDGGTKVRPLLVLTAFGLQI